MITVKIIQIDEENKCIIAKVWDETLKKHIDEYPPVAVNFNSIDFNKDIHVQLADLLAGQLQFQKNSEFDTNNINLDKLKELIGVEAGVIPDFYVNPLPLDKEEEQIRNKAAWDSGV